MSDSGQKKILLWAIPRSISTAFFRAMMNRSSIKVLLEPYSKPYYWGPERVSKRYADAEVNCEELSFADVKAIYESDYEGYKEVFAKDMAYYLNGKLATPALLPGGYVHTFLMRDPHKSVYSLYKMSLNKELTGWNYFEAAEVGFKELYHLYELVTKTLKREAIVLDADDLLQYPETMLKIYCEKCGIQYESAMVNWEDVPSQMEIFQDWMPWFEGVLTSNTFQPSATKPPSPLIYPDLPKHVRQAIDENMVYYNKLKAVRLRPRTLMP